MEVVGLGTVRIPDERGVSRWNLGERSKRCGDFPYVCYEIYVGSC